MRIPSLRAAGALRTAWLQAPAMRLVLVGSIVVTLSFLSVFAVVIVNARSDAARQADQEAENVAVGVSQDIARNIELFDQTLQSASEGLQLPGIWQLSPEIRNAVLFGRAAKTPFFGFVNALNADGDVIADSTTLNPPNRNWATRDYFIEHRRNPDNRVFIGKPIETGANLPGSITISRRISTPDGGFAGVVVGSMQLSYVRDLFARLNVGPRGSIALLRSDGTILMRAPFDGNDIGRVVRADAPFFTFARSGEQRVVGVTGADGVLRRLTFRQIGDLPLVVVVGVATGDVFAAWQEKSVKLGMIVGGLCLASFILTGLLRRELRRRAAAEAMYRQLTEDIGDVVTRIDENGICRFASRAARRVLGVGPEDLLGLRFADRLHPADHVAFEQWLEHLRRSAEAPALRLRSRREDGALIRLEAAAGQPSASTDQQAAGFVVLLRDVTAQYQLEQERAEREIDLQRGNRELDDLAKKLSDAADAADRANEAKSRFLATMSHEVRTPLNCIMGYAELIARDANLGASQERWLAVLRDAAEHLRAIVERGLNQTFFDFRRVRQEHVDLPVLLEQVRAQLDPPARAKALHLHCDVEHDVPHEIATDGTYLRQVLLNLGNNAIKFTTRGEVALRACRHNGSLRLSVTDTGCGIPADRRAWLFREFERFDASRRGIEGLGIGLPVASQLAKILGGEIGYEDNPDGGSIFWLELPMPKSARNSTGRREASPNPLRILLVDDDWSSGNLAASFLREAGHTVTEAKHGAEAVDLASTDDFDIVLMDMRMAGMDGAEATRRIRHLPGRRGRVPVVAVTAQTPDEAWDSWSAAGVDEYLGKPYKRDSLLATVEAVVRSSPRPPQQAEAGRTADAVHLPASLSELVTHLGCEVVRRHLSELDGVVAALLAMLEAGLSEPSSAEDIVHRIAGDAEPLGFAELTQAARTFLAALRQRRDDIPAATAALGRVAAEARQLLAQYRSSL